MEFLDYLVMPRYVDIHFLVRLLGDIKFQIRVYPPESKTRKMLFIVPEKYPNKHNTEKTLSELTGGRVVVEEIRPYTGYEPGATYVTRDQNGDK